MSPACSDAVVLESRAVRLPLGGPKRPGPLGLFSPIQIYPSTPACSPRMGFDFLSPVFCDDHFPPFRSFARCWAALARRMEHFRHSRFPLLRWYRLLSIMRWPRMQRGLFMPPMQVCYVPFVRDRKPYYGIRTIFHAVIIAACQESESEHLSLSRPRCGTGEPHPAATLGLPPLPDPVLRLHPAGRKNRPQTRHAVLRRPHFPARRHGAGGAPRPPAA